MKMVVGVERRLEGLSEDVADENSGLVPLKQGADPIVYKLVRVDFDGRFIPATDDELVEVANLLELEKCEMLPIPDVVGTIGHVSDGNDTIEKPLLEKQEGLSQIKLTEDGGTITRAHVEDSLPKSTSSSKDRRMKGSGNSREESSSSLDAGSNKVVSAGSQPKFSLIKGELNLDNLTVRELQETFRATFGRKTSVKDKMWLKRRISMGLKNSCDVSVSSFAINDEKLMKETEEPSKKMDCEDSVAGEIVIDVDNGPMNSISGPNLRQDVVNETDLRDSFTELGCRSDDNFENRSAKRVRKPTKRYIEELTDRKRYTGGKSMAPSKHFEEDKASPRVTVKPTWGAPSGDFVTRPESIGGSGIQLPYVSQIQRCRPRESIMVLSNFDSNDAALARKVVESSVEVSDPLPKRVKVEPKEIPDEKAIASEESEEKPCLSSMSDVSQAKEQISVDSKDNTPDNTSGNSSDDRVATVLAANGGARRKHHRAWSLTEVTKLVDGVAKFGAGRWSEIKRLSFSSYPHRTPVDLKDKWRNLLKASFMNSQSDKGINARKNMQLPIPASILVRVKELAELNSQSPPVKASSNNSGSSVN